MSISLDLVTRIGRDVAAEQGAKIENVTIASGDGESGRVELLIVLADCELESCRIMLNLSRNEPSVLEEELRAKLSEALAAAPKR